MKKILLIVLISINIFALEVVPKNYKHNIKKICIDGYIYYIYSGYREGGIAQAFYSESSLGRSIPIKCNIKKR